jgi:hypothetical protein
MTEAGGTMVGARRVGPDTIAGASALVLSAAVLVVALVVSGAQAAPGTTRLNFTLRLDSGAAPLIAGKRIGTFSQAIRVVGRPARLFPAPGAALVCRASWPTLELTIEFSTSQAACSAQNLGSWAQVTATSPRWHTTPGLHVGDSERRLHALYPHARRLDFLGQGRVWELETGGPYCDGGPPLSLGAHVRATRINALTILHVPACG